MFNATTGKLKRQLHEGEYDIFKYAQIFESDFIQITKRGEMIDVHNHVHIVTMGVTFTSPILPVPDVMLLAHPATSSEEQAGLSKVTKKKSRRAEKAVELTRLLPLKFVWISIHDREKQQLRLKFPTGRSCYLQLSPHKGARDDLFACWENLVFLLRPPGDSNNSTYTSPAGDMTNMPVSEEDGRSLAVADFPGKEDQNQINIRNLHVAGATSAAFTGGEGIQYDSHRFTAMPDVAAPNTKRTEPDKVSAAGATAGVRSRAITKSAAPESHSVAIAGAATRGPDGKQTTAMAGAANKSPKPMKMALAAAVNKFSKRPANISLSSGTCTSEAKAEPTGKTAGGKTKDRAAGPLTSSSPREGIASELARRQPGARPRAEAPKSRRDGREQRDPKSRKDGQERRDPKKRKDGQEQRERERVPRNSSHRRATERHHKPGGDKVPQKPPGRSSARQRNDEEEKSSSSPGDTAPQGICHAPIIADSRTSHISGNALSTSSSGFSSKRISRISSLLRSIKANLATKTTASPHSKGVDNSAKTMERTGLEAVTEV